MNKNTIPDWGEAYTDGLRYRVGACHLVDNVSWQEDATGYQCSSHAHFSFCTDATEVVFECTDYSHYSDYVVPVILKDGVFMATLPVLSANEPERCVAVVFPPGRKTVTVINSLQTNGAWGAEPKNYTVRAMTATAPLYQTLPAWRKNPTVIYGDSIAAGGNADVPGMRAWGTLLRRDRAIAFEASGWRRLADHTHCLDEVTARIARYQPTTVWLAVGVNDYQGPDPLIGDAFTQTYAQALDFLRQRLPHATVIAQSPLVKVGESAPNAVGMTLDDYRHATRLATVGRPWSHYIDGSTILTVTDLADGVHPHTAGMAKYAAFARKILHDGCQL